MVDDHHRTNDVPALGPEAIWERLRAGTRLSAMKDGVHLFSFELRPNGAVKALVGGAYLAVGRVLGDAKRLAPPPAKWDHQAPMDAPERRDVCRLFDNDLFQGRAPTAFILVTRDRIDAANERSYEAAQPDIYRYVIDQKLVSYLYSIRNLGCLSPGQERVLRKWLAGPRKGRIVPPANRELTPAEKSRAEAQARMDANIERRRREREEQDF